MLALDAAEQMDFLAELDDGHLGFDSAGGPFLKVNGC